MPLPAGLPLLVGLPRAALPLAGALMPALRRWCVARPAVLLAGRPRGVCGGPGPPDLVHGLVEHARARPAPDPARRSRRATGPATGRRRRRRGRPPRGPDCGQAEPDHPPVAGLGLTPRVAGGDQAVRGRGQRRLGDRQPLGQPRGPLAAGARPASGCGTAAGSGRYRPAPGPGTAAAGSSRPARHAARRDPPGSASVPSRSPSVPPASRLAPSGSPSKPSVPFAPAHLARYVALTVRYSNKLGEAPIPRDAHGSDSGQPAAC